MVPTSKLRRWRRRVLLSSSSVALLSIALTTSSQSANVDAVALAVAETFAPSADPMQIVSDMIDAALNRYEAEPGAITLILELSHTQAYHETAARSDARIAAALAEIAAGRLCRILDFTWGNRCHAESWLAREAQPPHLA